MNLMNLVISNIIDHLESWKTCIFFKKLNSQELDCYKLVDVQAVNMDSSKWVIVLLLLKASLGPLGRKVIWVW